MLETQKIRWLLKIILNGRSDMRSVISTVLCVTSITINLYSQSVVESIGFSNPPAHQQFLTGQASPMIYGSTSGGSIPSGSNSLILQAGSSSYSNRHLFMRTGDETRLFIHYNGNVGIGTDNPQAKLAVQGEILITRNYPYVQLNSTHWGGLGSFIQSGVTNAAVGGGDYTVIYNPQGKAFNFRQGNYDAMTINPSGKVGIGTLSPSAQLDVVGPATGTGPTLRALGGGDVVLNTGGSLFLDGNYSYSSGSYIRPAGGNNTQAFFTAGVERLRINANGKIGIGTSTPDQALTVKGKIHAEEVIIDLSVPAPDYVFEKLYDLKSLDEVKKYIDENKHLPEVPSAKELAKDGVKVGEMEMILLKKIEELTLHLIEADKQMKILQEKNNEQDNKISAFLQLQNIKN
jgi:hypothetical protein